MNPLPTHLELDADRSAVVFSRLLRAASADHADAVDRGSVLLRNLEKIALLGTRFAKEPRQVSDPILVPCSALRVEAVVVVDDPQAQRRAIRRLAIDPRRGIKGRRIERWKKGK